MNVKRGCKIKTKIALMYQWEASTGWIICKFGSYILDRLKKENIFGNGNLGFYRHDCLAIIDNLPRPRLERKIKKTTEDLQNH